MKRMKYIVKIYFRFDGLITGDLITGGGGGGGVAIIGILWYVSK